MTRGEAKAKKDLAIKRQKEEEQRVVDNKDRLVSAGIAVSLIAAVYLLGRIS